MEYRVLSMKVKSFADLLAWQKGHSLVIEIYLVTRTFPKEEQFGLISQLRRAVVSITSNIAEGFYRRTSIDKNHFYNTSLGSTAEVFNQLIISKDLEYISKEKFVSLKMRCIEIKRLINGLIKSSRTK